MNLHKSRRACVLALIALGGSAAGCSSDSPAAAGATAGAARSVSTGAGTPATQAGGGGAAPATGGSLAGGAPAAGGGGSGPAGSSGGGQPAAAEGEPARAADSFVDIIGVNGHLNYDGSVYIRLFDAAIAPRTAELGIRNWRDALSSNADALQRQMALAALGVRFDLLVQELDVGTALALTKKAISVAASIEGPNELDHGFRNGLPAYPDASTRTYKGIGFPGVVAAFQNDLYAAIKGDSDTRHLPVLMAGFSFPDNTLSVGLVDGCDCANTHSYPDGGPPTFRLDDWYIPRMRVNAGPDKPLCATETGYHTTPMPNGQHWIPAVSQRAASKYELRLMLEYYNRGFEKVFLYEFADAASSNEVADLNFGLLASDGTPKAQFFALKRLIQLLSDPGASFPAQRLDYQLSGAPPELQHTLLQKRDGRFYLVVWLNRASFDPKARRDLESSQKVSLALRSTVSRLTLHLPVDATDEEIPATQVLVLEVSDQPLVLEIAQ